MRWICSQVTHQEALLEQQKLKLKLQQQTLLQQQLEQQIQDYQRQLADIYGTTGAPAGPSPSRTLRAPDEQRGAPYEGATSLEDSVSEGLFPYCCRNRIVAMLWQQHLSDNCDNNRWVRFSHCGDHNETSLFPVLKLVKLVPPFKGNHLCSPKLFILGHFPFVRAGWLDHGQTSLFENQ